MGLLEHTAWLTRQHGTEGEFLKCKEAVASVLTELRTQILRSIFAEYPELDLSSPAYSMESGGAYPGGALLGERYQPRSGGELGDRKDEGIDKELAAHLNYFFVHCSHLLMQVIRLLDSDFKSMEEEELEKRRKGVAYVLADMGFQFFYDLGDKYPDIDPLSPSYIGDRAIHEGSFLSDRPPSEPGPSRLDPTDQGVPVVENTFTKGTRMDKDIAARLAYISRSCGGLLRHTVWLVKQQGTEEDFNNYKKAMGRVLVELQTRLLDPIYAEYPDLDHKSPAFSGPPAYQHEEKYLPEDEDYPDDAGPEGRNT